jgi:response regulator of citrate/malate metabolism
MLVLLAAKPGPLRDGLDALLDSIPEVNLVTHANDMDAACSFIQQHPTQLMILDMKPGDGSMLAFISEEEDRVAAEAAGADMVLVTGTRASKLKEAVTDSLVLQD